MKTSDYLSLNIWHI